MSETQGRRVPSDTAPWDLEPGDYMVTEDGVAWVRLPNGVGPSRLEGWGLEEHDDGTITLTPSIQDVPADGSPGWHGYIERGVWREV